MTEPNSAIRINKYLAQQKIASRREADALIAAGKILINGLPAKLGQLVTPEDKISLTTKTPTRTYLAYYKGRGVITHSPAQNEIDITTKIAEDFGVAGLAPVGRLDKDSEGLIILTNDGRVTGRLLEPSAGREKEYDVTVDKNITPAFATMMSKGVVIEGYKTKTTSISPHPNNSKRFSLTLTEGKKHQIRRMCAALGYQVQSLKRVRIMNIKLDKLKPNQYRKLAGAELKTWLEALGL